MCLDIVWQNRPSKEAASPISSIMTNGGKGVFCFSYRR